MLSSKANANFQHSTFKGHTCAAWECAQMPCPQTNTRGCCRWCRLALDGWGSVKAQRDPALPSRHLELSCCTRRPWSQWRSALRFWGGIKTRFHVRNINCIAMVTMVLNYFWPSVLAFNMRQTSVEQSKKTSMAMFSLFSGKTDIGPVSMSSLNPKPWPLRERT